MRVTSPVALPRPWLAGLRSKASCRTKMTGPTGARGCAAAGGTIADRRPTTRARAVQIAIRVMGAPQVDDRRRQGSTVAGCCLAGETTETDARSVAYRHRPTLRGSGHSSSPMAMLFLL